MKLLRVALAWLLLCGPVLAQSQIGSGLVMGNSGASRAVVSPSTVTAILDRALGSTRGAILERGSGGWAIVGPGTAGLPWVSAGAGADPSYALLGIIGGGTGINVYAIGDIICASGTTTLSRLADVATGNALISGGVGACPSYGKITSSHLNISTTSCTNQYLTAISATAGGTCSTITLASASFANQGTTTTVLHGNAAGNPAFGSVVSADLNITTTSCTNQVVTAISASASGTCSSVAYAMLATAAIATTAEYYAGTASKLVQSGVIYAAEVDLGNSGTGTQTIDFSTFINARTTMTGNISTQTLSNVAAGKAGTITFIQDGTGSRTTVWSTTFKFAGGAIPALSTAINTVDILTYSCRSATFCAASLMKDVRNP